MSRNYLFLSLLLGVVGLSAGYLLVTHESDSPGLVNSQQNKYSSSSALSSPEELSLLLGELERVIENGGHINPERYDEFKEQVNVAVEQGMEEEAEEHILSLLSQLKVGGREDVSKEKVAVEPETNPYSVDPPPVKQSQENMPPPPPPEPKTDAEVEVQEQGFDIEWESKELTDIGPLPQPRQSCERNREPAFTHHITDVYKIKYITPPPTMGKNPDGDSQLKTHSYVGTDGKRIPVYAPVDMVLDTGAHYTGGPYWFGFEVSCEIRLRFGHITEPVEKIKEVFPAEPDVSSNDHKPSHTVQVEAGELIGYTIGTNPGAGNWDFGVYDLLSRNRYAEHSELGWVASTAVCPYDYYSEEMRSVYSDKFDFTILSGNPQDGESFCK